MVDVGVGNNDCLDAQAVLFEDALDAADFVPGIDDDGLARLLVAEDGAVALQHADGHDLVDHKSIVAVVRFFFGEKGCPGSAARGTLLLFSEPPRGSGSKSQRVSTTKWHGIALVKMRCSSRERRNRNREGMLRQA